MPPIITLTTDFGLQDTYVGAMKGAILSVAPDAQVVDLCHGVPPQDVLAGALALEAAYHVFPVGTVHVVVVDPGVGSDRAAVAVQTSRYQFVGPDNGVLAPALDRESVVAAVRLTNRAYHRQPVCSTFHGRDIFGPAAAHLAAGVPLRELGEAMVTLVVLDVPSPVERAGALQAHVLLVDHFGNLITDLRGEALERWRGGQEVEIEAGAARLQGVHATYAAVAEGEPVAYIGSSGRLEIGVRNGGASDDLRVCRGAMVHVRRLS